MRNRPFLLQNVNFSGKLDKVVILGAKMLKQYLIVKRLVS